MLRRVLLAVPAAIFMLAAPAGAQDASGPADAQRQQLTITTEQGERRFQVEIADEPHEQSFGLMNRRAMADDVGMLFDFGLERPASFWMKNTYISLDMIFVRADGTIESIAERTTPLSERGVPSQGPVRYVLEVNGGLSDELGIAPGDSLSGPAIESLQ